MIPKEKTMKQSKPFLMMVTLVAALAILASAFSSVKAAPARSVSVQTDAALAGLPLLGVAGFLLLWALRPNIRRLLNGTERMVGLRARRKRAREQSQGYSSSSNSSSS
jgi:glycerol-3-phosphate acyltransferase PlsY